MVFNRAAAVSFTMASCREDGHCLGLIQPPASSSSVRYNPAFSRSFTRPNSHVVVDRRIEAPSELENMQDLLKVQDRRIRDRNLKDETAHAVGEK